MRAWLKHAFAVEQRAAVTPSPEERELVERLARGIVQRGLMTPAVIALDCSHNLNFIASQTMRFFQPVVQTLQPLMQVLFKGRDYELLMGFLERRGSIEYICRRIESLYADGEQPAPDGSRPTAPHKPVARSGPDPS